MRCPNCGSEQPGAFCGECGAPMDGSCAACGATLPEGTRYCTSCGEPRGRAQASRGSRTGWIVATAAVLVALLVLFFPRDTERVPPPPGPTRSPVGSPGGAGAGGAGPGALSSDMRTNADRLFNRVMMAAEQRDEAEVEQFIPMAIRAYEMVDDLDDDGLYHLAVLHLTTGEPDAARRAAQRILDDSPGHLLALGVAAQAESEAGDTDAARSLWERLLESYPSQTAAPAPEYEHHQTMLTEYRRMALEATDGS